jgi:septal ring-binding cell division protein DamX
MAADQRFCLNCGMRRGDPRVPEQAPETTEVVPVAPASRPADVSPLAAVIGIALLGGMLLIGVLIGREAGGDSTTPAPVVQVGSSTTTAAVPPTTTPATTTPDSGGDPAGGGAAAIASEWPEGTNGFTVQLSAIPKAGATQEDVDAAKQGASDQGATDAAVLDSDLYPTLPPGQYIVYSGVYSDRKSAQAGLKDLGKNFANATVVEVSADAGGAK